MCPLCGSVESEFLFWNYDRLYHLPGRFGVVKCKVCGLVRLSPRPTKENLGYYYPEDDYYSYQRPKASINDISSIGFLSKLRNGCRYTVLTDLGYGTRKLTVLQTIIRPILRRIFFRQATYGWEKRFPQYKENGVVLDIGCGSGSYLSFLKFHGWKVVGVDLSSKAAKSAKKNFDIDVIVGDISDLSFPRKNFDRINMSHVLEHVTNPTSTLERVRDLLKDDGSLYIEVPNCESYSCKVTKQYWFPWETPRHLFLFSPATLTRQIEAAGLQIIDISTKNEPQFDVAARYEFEESQQRRMTNGMTLSRRAMMKVWFRTVGSRIRLAVSPMSGDFLCCLVKKDLN